MSNRVKNSIYSAILLVSVLVVFLYRRAQEQAPDAAKPEPVMIDGRTMGTTYHITYFDEQDRNFKSSVDSLLEVFNQSLNTYLPGSEITRFNNGSSSLRFGLPYLPAVLEGAQEISRATAGAFDPTVMPLVNTWGFGPGRQFQPDSAQVDSMLQFVGFNHVSFNSDSVWKADPRTQLDFSAIAKGYGVDVVAGFLKAKGITDMFVEIGGEVVTMGKNIKKERPWTVGILNPNSTPEAQQFMATAGLENRALATSGNYFNYRIVNGKKYSHTIDPHTGYPVQREILSASIFAADCMTADAWATACMVMGHDKAIALLKQQPDIDAFLVYSGPDGTIQTYTTPGAEKAITLTDQ